MARASIRHGAGTLLAVLLGGCSLAPAYRPPAIAAPPAFKEAGAWAPANPGQPAGRRWADFDDPVLAGLEDRLDADNPTIAQALARHEAARADLAEASASLLPQVDLGGASLANRQSANRPLRGSNQPDLYSADTLGGSAGYELDLWGRLRDSVAAGKAREVASADDLVAVRLALEADLARSYLELRGADKQIELLQAAVATYARVDRLIRNRFAGGIVSGIDLARSAAQLGDAEAQLAELRAGRAVIEHAIATLVGVPASAFALPPSDRAIEPPPMPAEVPATLLQRRPDVAAAERRMFAANREIGVARAAYFPQFILGGAAGYQSTALAGLVAAPNLFWSVGPAVALNLFDGGRRRAREARARAAWEAAAADYRRTALAAFAQTEDALARVHHLGDAAAAEQRSVDAAMRAGQLELTRYDKGATDFLTLALTQAAELAARRRAIQYQVRRVQAGVDLAWALGGGWKAER